MIKHRKCTYCGKIGHKTDMIEHEETDLSLYPLPMCHIKYWYHEECFCQAKNMKRCECGQGWVSKKK